MNNEPTASGEPVAYAMFRDGEYYDAIHPDEQAKTAGEYDIPLYTAEQLHPADESFDRTASHMAGEYVSYPAKTLTGAVGSLSDEEIKQIMSEFYSYNPRLLDFARAILRKAQEKWLKL